MCSVAVELIWKTTLFSVYREIKENMYVGALLSVQKNQSSVNKINKMQ